MLKIILETIPASAPDMWVVYKVTQPPNPEVLFIGLSEFHNVTKLYQLAGNPLFNKSLRYRIESLSTHESRWQALNAQGEACQANGHMPIFNKVLHMSKGGIVLCNETLEVFKTAHDCAIAHNIAPSRLSNHLNKRIGYKTINKRTYRRVTLESIGGARALIAGKAIVNPL